MRLFVHDNIMQSSWQNIQIKCNRFTCWSYISASSKFSMCDSVYFSCCATHILPLLKFMVLHIFWKNVSIKYNGGGGNILGPSRHCDERENCNTCNCFLLLWKPLVIRFQQIKLVYMVHCSVNFQWHKTVSQELDKVSVRDTLAGSLNRINLLWYSRKYSYGRYILRTLFVVTGYLLNTMWGFYCEMLNHLFLLTLQTGSAHHQSQRWFRSCLWLLCRCFDIQWTHFITSFGAKTFERNYKKY